MAAQTPYPAWWSNSVVKNRVGLISAAPMPDGGANALSGLVV
ncbi:hypothetical protein OGY35_16205 [Citrobacter sp. Ct235]|nr:hypothetical protein [Citrobacter sp. Ct235]MDM2736905.1 hypothetical protein [Citrobacter sp. Ct235]